MVASLPLPGSRTTRGTSTIGGVRPGGRSAGLGVRSRSRRRRLPGSGSAASRRRGTTSVAGIQVMGAGPLAFGHDSHLPARVRFPMGRPGRLRARCAPPRAGGSSARPARGHASGRARRGEMGDSRPGSFYNGRRRRDESGALSGRGDAWRTWGSVTGRAARARCTPRNGDRPRQGGGTDGPRARQLPLDGTGGDREDVDFRRPTTTPNQAGHAGERSAP
jgi:hypothetical protein